MFQFYIWIFSTHFQYSLQYHENPSSARRADTNAWTHDVRMVKPIGAFRDYVSPPKNICSQRQYFYERFQNCEERPLASTCLSVRLSVRASVHVKQLGSHWTDFHEILYLSIFPKSVKKVRH